jgi:aryl-alcohol dehydrogenase-like predicted oxidoreductase
MALYGASMANFTGTELDVHPLCLGGNVFGWTADQPTSFAVLDAYAAAGGNFVDTADGYSAWVPGNQGGESETIIGAWMAERGNRDDVVVATKAGKDKPMDEVNVRAKAEASLRRLQTDHIDLYYVHFDDENVPLEETLGVFDALVREGKVRHVALSNYTPARLTEAMAVAAREGFAKPVAFQPHYNLVERSIFEDELQGVAEREGLGVVPYWALASGFLTGKYRPDGPDVDSARSGAAGKYLDDRGRAVLTALDGVAAEHDTTVAAIALAWLAAQPTVVAPIASARTVEQLAGLLPMAEVELTADQLAVLDEASAGS